MGKRELIEGIIGHTRMAESEEAEAAATALPMDGDEPVLVIVVPMSKIKLLLP
jgi:hypothetical protein